MGDVAVLLKILPTDVELDINVIKDEVVKKVKPLCEVNNVEINEVGFGLKAIKLQVIVPDQEGKIDQVEQTISSVDGVGQVDTEEVTLV
ncbi:MAG: elongation factor 1-beta [Candidatus Thermoplasmatota archaeon]|nr:elongation factor 1-beta [Candidatus Thermoplasmatota archaeon]MCL5955374.1 elongation factor 1-beta [Candidatus Thermoplasmatota archaeon]